MPLEYPAEWKFDGIGVPIPQQACSEFIDLIEKTVAGISNPQPYYEAIKSAFGSQSWSSSPSWAQSDMTRLIGQAADNAALFVASLWEGMEQVKELGIGVPSAHHLNRILSNWDVPLSIEPPHLVLTAGDIDIGTTSDEKSEEKTISIFTRGDLIGRGGFGAVYKVTRTTRVGKFDFAMKVLDPSSFIKNRERALARFKREMQVLATLQHRGIIQHIEAGLDRGGQPYIIMPLIEGAHLQAALSGAASSQVFAVFDAILDALEYAHTKGVVHRDLKPSNILVRSSDFQPIILDFGCAYLFDDANQQDLTTTLVGSASYIPAEVMRNPTHRTTKQDVYACGIMLYQILGGRLPDPDDYAPLERTLTGCQGIDDLVQSAIAPEKRRLESARVFQQRLRRIAAKTPD